MTDYRNTLAKAGISSGDVSIIVHNLEKLEGAGFRGRLDDVVKFFNRVEFRLLVLFLGALFLSSLSAARLTPSIYFFVRLLTSIIKESFFVFNSAFSMGKVKTPFELQLGQMI